MREVTTNGMKDTQSLNECHAAEAYFLTVHILQESWKVVKIPSAGQQQN